jgi:hypothetical protein
MSNAPDRPDIPDWFKREPRRIDDLAATAEPLCNPDGRRAWSVCHEPKGHDGQHIPDPTPTIDPVAPDPTPSSPDRWQPNMAPLLAHMDAVEQDPVPRRPTVADVMRDAFDAMDAQRLPTPEQAAVHAAERAFLAAYRAHRDARVARQEALAAWEAGQSGATWEEWQRRCRETSVRYDEARNALDAADAAARDGAK